MRERKQFENLPALNPYQVMWLLVLFDLPVVEKEDRKEYTNFHKFLIADGFTMMQFSVYMRYCPSPENAEVHRRRVAAHVPPEGEVRVIQMTSKQFEMMEIYLGKIRKPPESEPSQLTLF